MSYPGYPPQNPSYPPQPNLPYPTDPRQPIGFNQASYPPMGPFPAYPNAPAPTSAPSYPPMSHPGTYAPAPYPTGFPPHPASNLTPGFPPTQAPYPTQSYVTQTQAYPSQTYPSQAPAYPTQPQAYPTQSQAYPTQSQAYPTQSQAYPTQSQAYPSLSQTQSQTYPTQQQVSHSSVQSRMTASAPATKMTPTIVPKQPFDARQDAELLRKAMKGLGTDEKAIINVLAYRTNQQRAEILAQYKALFGKDLIKDLKSELSGKFEDIIMAVMTPLPEYLARELHEAIDGIGTNENTLVEILCTMNNSWIHAINAQYQRLYKKPLENDIKGDTSGYFQRLLVSLCQGRRDENPTVDMGAATADAHALYKAGAGQLGTDEATFNMILVSRSLPQLRQVFIEYEKLSGKPFEDAIKSEFSGSIETGLLAIVKSVRDCPGFYAERLYSSMAGAGTNDQTLIRVITVRAEFDLGDIKNAFQTKYKKSLASFIEGDTSGDYKKMLLAMIA